MSKIDVNDGIIRIVGPSNAAVLHAREMLELLQVPHKNIETKTVLLHADAILPHTSTPPLLPSRSSLPLPVCVVQSDMELCEGVGNWLTRPMLGDIRDKSECSLIRVLDGEDLVRIIGTKKQVRGPSQVERTGTLNHGQERSVLLKLTHGCVLVVVSWWCRWRTPSCCWRRRWTT